MISNISIKMVFISFSDSGLGKFVKLSFKNCHITKALRSSFLTQACSGNLTLAKWSYNVLAVSGPHKLKFKH